MPYLTSLEALQVLQSTLDIPNRKNMLDESIDTLGAGNTGPKDIPYHHESTFPLDRSLYSETIDNDNRQLKDLLQNKGYVN